MNAKTAALSIALRLLDGDGGGVEIRGTPAPLWAEPDSTKAGRPCIAVFNSHTGRKVQRYYSGTAFASDLARILAAGVCQVSATDAHSRRYYYQPGRTTA